MRRWLIIVTLGLTSPFAVGQAVATSIPLAPPASAPVMTAPLTSVPITQPVPPPLMRSYDDSYWATPIWRPELTSSSAETQFNRGVHSDAAAFESIFDDGTYGRSLGDIARENRERKQPSNARELTNDDLRQMYAARGASGAL